MIKAFTISALVCSLLQSAFACTTALVTKGASADGSVFVTHSNDGYTGDTSVVYVPASDHAEGEKRAVYPSACAREPYPTYNTDYTPRLNVKGRGPDYQFEGEKETLPLGYIPQVEHTYAYLDSNYGIINEHGLMLGECTDSSRRIGYIHPEKTEGIFYSSELGRVALERCKKAREAVVLMGKLIDEYGLWGTAETLLVADKEEGYVLEMAPNPSGKGGFWVAQKVPDGEFFIAANQFRIRGLNPENKDQIFNLAMLDELKNLGWAKYDKDGYLDWLRSIDSNEYSHPYACLRRVWRGLDIAAPSLKLPAWVEGFDTYAYPFSVKPDKKMTVDDLMKIHRDTYDNTEFDYSKGETGGLFAHPYSFGLYNKERVISVTSITYIWINQVNDKLPAPISWIALTSPAQSVFVPLPVAPITKRYSRVDRKHYDPTKAYWAATEVGTLTRGYYSALIPIVRQTAGDLEAKSKQKIEDSLNLSKDEFNKMLIYNADECFSVWKALPSKLVEHIDSGANLKYAKGHEPNYIKIKSYKNTNVEMEDLIAKNAINDKNVALIEDEQELIALNSDAAQGRQSKDKSTTTEDNKLNSKNTMADTKNSQTQLSTNKSEKTDADTQNAQAQSLIDNMNKSDNTKTDKSEDKSIPESKKDTDSQAL
ncbi:C69 family dipeptidase [Succinivibrio sp.]|uniref:C69 family dipeptidase n=1 Tax=Succinivibrio sp. TaxID=2053619 RepID=UPI00386873FA